MKANSSESNPTVKPLEVIGLRKTYGTVVALVGLDLALEPGCFHALLGPNGAGKSTLMQILTGLFLADAGSVRVCGRDLASSPSQALSRMGVVFQQPALDLDLSVWANLLFHSDLHGLSRRIAHHRIEQGLASVGLSPDLLPRTARELSGGNRRKVELLRALLHRPDVLLMDEATVGLDPQSRHQLLRTVRHLCSHEGVTVLWATHLLEEVKEADTLFVLKKGELIFSGTPHQLVRQSPEQSVSEFETLVLDMMGHD